jgi:DNA primase catalytic subunit
MATVDDIKSKAITSIDRVNSISGTISSSQISFGNQSSDISGTVSSITDTVTSGVKDPIGSVLNRTIKKVINLNSQIDKKIDELTKKLEDSLKQNGRVELIGKRIVITVTPEEKDKADVQKIKINNQIESIRKSLNILTNTLKVIESITKTISILNTALQIQEILLTVNPVSKATFEVFKKAIKIVFLKDMLKEYNGFLQKSLVGYQSKLNSQIERFRNLTVEIKVKQSSDIGGPTNPIVVDQAITNSLVSTDPGVDTTVFDYTDMNGKKYILKIENYDSRRIIGRAYESFSGLIAAQTAPSFISTAQELKEELILIINAG